MRYEFITPSIVAAVHRVANRRYFGKLLTVLAEALEEEGFSICEVPEHNASHLSDPVRTRVAMKVCTERHLHLAPWICGEDLERTTEQDAQDGNAQMWLDTLLDGLAEEGFYPRSLEA